MSNRLYSQSVELFNQRKLDKSLKNFKKLSNIYPKNENIMNYLALNYIFLSQFNNATLVLKELITLNNQNVGYYLNLSYCYENMNDFEQAINNYKFAIQNIPNEAQLHINLASIYKYQRKFDEAENVLKKSLYLNSYKLFSTLAGIYADQNKFDQVMEFSKKALDLNQSDFIALNNIAKVYMEEKNFEEASKYLGKALHIEQNNFLIHLNLGTLYKNLNQLDKAKDHYNKSISINPKAYDAYLYKSLIELSENNFLDGWKNYEFRWFKQAERISITKPKWDGKKLNQKIIIWGEQGLGEQILFTSILPELEQSFERIILVIDEKLKLIYQESFPNIKIFIPEDEWSKEEFDCHLPIGSLGKFFRNDVQSFPNRNNFLKTNAINDRGTNLKCGLSWKSVNSVEGDLKSIELENLLPILKNKNLDFYNIQYTNEKENIDQFNKQYNLKIQNIQGLDTFNDLHGLSKYLKSFDFIITISNTTAHLAGSLGVPTLLMLPKNIGKLWYWNNSIDSKSMWYPSVRIFKQNVENDWNTVILEINRYIQDYFYN